MTDFPNYSWPRVRRPLWVDPDPPPPPPPAPAPIGPGYPGDPQPW